MSNIITGNLDGAELRIGIVVSRWNTDITSALRMGAERVLISCGVSEGRTTIVEVPGAFEIPLACQQLAESGCDAVIALGCVVKGDTAHFEYVSEAAMHGIREVALRTGVPVTCGILTTYDMEQAVLRASADENNKGSEAALAAIETASLLRQLKKEHTAR